jgi:hypothetical protein
MSIRSVVIDQEAGIAEFLALARSCRERRLKAAEIMQEMIRFFRDVGISGTEVPSGSDMVMLQWGVSDNLGSSNRRISVR